MPQIAGGTLQEGHRAGRVPAVGCGLSLLWCSGTALAVDPGVVITKPAIPAETQAPEAQAPEFQEPILQPYEPLTAGCTKDSDDVSYLDVTLSLKIRLLPQHALPRSRLFLAMTTRFGFYWGTRPNSPVIGKDYNPKLLWRYLPPKTPASGGESHQQLEEYIDIGYAHESNGQLIHTQAEYQQELAALMSAQYADNFIHRGWDYPEITWKKALPDRFVLYLDGKYFLPYGLLQGREDQYHPWENNPQGKPRRLVDGAEADLAYPRDNVYVPLNGPTIWFGEPNLTVKYKTGNDTPFKYSTVRAELGGQFLALPMALWVQHGYMSDLAMYYQKVTSYGIELRFESF
jgi:hypothetical protein